jgi:hypothetical protein
MTPQEIESIKNDIAKVKRALAADKRRWGGQYHDGHGLRYILPGFYLQLQNWDGALKIFKWFEKNFPDDSGYPMFLFEWTVTLFNTGDVKGAEKKAFHTFFSNTYLFDKFLGKELLHFDKYEGSNWGFSSMVYELKYSKNQPELTYFADWLNQFLASDEFYKVAEEFIKIQKRLLEEPVGEIRTALVKSQRKLMDSYI